MLRTNTNQYKNNFKEMLNNELLNMGDDYCENINDLLLCFNNEYNYENNKRRYPNLQNRLSEYLSGLPYGFSFGYKYQILDFEAALRQVDEIPASKQEGIINNFYNHCAYMLIKLGSNEIVNELY